MVTGHLEIAPDVEAQTLAERLDGVYNYGVIKGTAAQVTALQARLKVNQGTLSDKSAQELSAKDNGYTLNNAVYLKF